MSNGTIDLFFRFRVKPGKQDQYQKAIDHIVSITEEQEPYVLAYEIYRDDDGVYAQHERYVDEDAMFRHLEVTATGQQDWAESTDVLEVFVLGDATERFWNQFGGPHAHG
jgi:quinol monooxygenase YgiN